MHLVIFVCCLGRSLTSSLLSTYWTTENDENQKPPASETENCISETKEDQDDDEDEDVVFSKRGRPIRPTARMKDFQSRRLVSRYSLSNNEKETTEEPLDVEKSIEEEIENYAQDRRFARSLDKETDVMLAMAWASPAAIRLFKLFPEVLEIDDTAGTNNESRPLISIVMRTRDGEFVPLIRVFAPNLQNWVFRWVFQTIIPKFLGMDYVQRVRAIVTDGDKQAIGQLDAFRSKFVLDLLAHLRCGWHIGDRGWEANGLRQGSYDKNTWKMVGGVFKAWIYSLMRFNNSPPETEEEYKISKALLRTFICDKGTRTVTIRTVPSPSLIALTTLASPLLPVAELLDEEAARFCDEFFTKHVEPHETNFATFLRVSLAHFEVWSNHGIEGYHAGIKKKAASAVNPSQSLFVATNVIASLAEVREHEIEKKHAMAQTKSKMYAVTPAGQEISHKSESLLRQQWEERDKYTSLRVANDTWRVIRTEHIDSTTEPSLPSADNEEEDGDDSIQARISSNEHFAQQAKCIAAFARVRVVRVDYEGYLSCSCCYCERNKGIPCRHAMHVACRMVPDFELSAADVGISWHTCYAHFGQRFGTPEEAKLSKLLDDLYLEGPKGIHVAREFVDNCNVPVTEESDIPVSLQLRSAIYRCRNYSPEVIKKALARFGYDRDGSGHPGCSQAHTINVGVDDDSDDGNTDAFAFIDFSADVTEVQRPGSTFYAEWTAIIKEAQPYINCTRSDKRMQDVKKQFAEALREIQGWKEEESGGRKRKQGQNESSHSAFQRTKTHHGTKYAHGRS